MIPAFLPTSTGANKLNMLFLRSSSEHSPAKLLSLLYSALKAFIPQLA